jgi:hypothetical protein
MVHGHTQAITVNVSNSGSASPVIPVGGFSHGSVLVPTGASSTSLTFYDCETEDGTYVQSYDEDNNALTIAAVAAGRTYRLPTDLFTRRFIRIVSNLDNSDLDWVVTLGY